MSTSPAKQEGLKEWPNPSDNLGVMLSRMISLHFQVSAVHRVHALDAWQWDIRPGFDLIILDKSVTGK